MSKEEKAIYLHSNGSLIEKRAIVYNSDPSYFTSSFVMKVWHRINEYKKEDWRMMLIDAIARGALPLEIERVGLEKGLSKQEIISIIYLKQEDD